MTSLSPDHLVGAVVLAAGHGVRLQHPELPKALVSLAGRPLVGYIVETLERLGFTPDLIQVVVGFKQAAVRAALGARVTYAEQTELRGTAEAAYIGSRALTAACAIALVVNADDSAFYTPQTLADFIARHRQAGSTVSVLTTKIDLPNTLGRIVRDAAGNFVDIKEKEELSAVESTISEVNTGAYCLERVWFEQAFPGLPIIPGLNEYGMPPVVAAALQQGKAVQAVPLARREEWFGINTSEELAEAERRKSSIPRPGSGQVLSPKS